MAGPLKCRIRCRSHCGRRCGGALREVAEERMGVADMLVAANESRR